MANILISFFQPVIGNLSSNIICYYESLISNLKNNGHSVRIFNMIFYEQYKDQLSDKIKEFSPNVIITFNNQIPEEILCSTDCTICLFDADSSEHFIHLELIEKYKERYYMVTQWDGWNTKYADLGFLPNRIINIHPATSIVSKDIPKVNNISFIGSKFEYKSINLRSIIDNSKNDHFYTLLQKYWNSSDLNFKNFVDNTYCNLTKFEQFSLFDSRNYILTSVLDLGVKLYGQNWNDLHCGSYALSAAFDREPKFSLKHNQDIYNSSIINLSISHPQTYGYAFPWRVYDIMASSGLLITSKSTLLETYTKGIVDIPSFTSPYEVRDLCKKYLREDNLRKDIIAASNYFIEKHGRWEDNFKIIENAINVKLLNVQQKDNSDLVVENLCTNFNNDDYFLMQGKTQINEPGPLGIATDTIKELFFFLNKDKIRVICKLLKELSDEILIFTSNKKRKFIFNQCKRIYNKFIFKRHSKITILIPLYNHASTLQRTLDSIFMQKVNFKYDICIIDDCSSDNGLEISLENQKKHSNIKIIQNKQNKGLLKSIFKGYKELKNKNYFCILDPDDYWIDKNHLHNAISFLEQNTEYSIYGTNTIIVDNVSARNYFDVDFSSYTTSYENFLEEMLPIIPSTQSTIFRNTVFKNEIPKILQSYIDQHAPESFRADTFRNIVHLRSGLAYFANNITAVYDMHGEGLWTGKSKASQDILVASFYFDFGSCFQENIDFYYTKTLKFLNLLLEPSYDTKLTNKDIHMLLRIFTNLVVHDAFASQATALLQQLEIKYGCNLHHCLPLEDNEQASI